MAEYTIDKIEYDGNVYKLQDNQSGYITVESDPVFSASAAAGISTADISNWNAKVSDDHKWNDVSLTKNLVDTGGADILIPYMLSSSAIEAKLITAGDGIVAKTVAIRDANGYIRAKTPSANDNSTKVATTAYVDNAVGGITIPSKTSDLTNDSGFIKQFIVTITENNDNYSADKTFSEIQAAYNQGYEVVCQSPNGAKLLLLQIDDSDGAMFEQAAINISGKPLGEVVTISPANEVEHMWIRFTETDPVFSASAAAGITSTDISNWNAKVSDDKTWNNKSLSIATTAGNDFYVPRFNSTSADTAYLTLFTITPTASCGVRYDGSAYLHSTTPSASDNSTKVATTAYVANALSGVAGTDEKVKVEPITSSNGTWYYPLLTSTTGTSTKTRLIDSTIQGLSYQLYIGTTSTDGQAILKLGNTTSSGTANNATGVLCLYGPTGRRINIKASTSSNNWQYFLPAGTGVADNAEHNLVGAYSVNAAVGSSSQPVYISQGGLAYTCSIYAGGTAVTLNGSSKSASTASFYAPTTAGTSGQVLTSSGSGAPTWVNFPSIPTKTSDLTNDSGFITASSLPADEIEVVEYNVSTFAEVLEAYENGKHIFCKTVQGGTDADIILFVPLIYVATGDEYTGFVFQTVEDEAIAAYYLDSEGWSDNTLYYSQATNLRNGTGKASLKQTYAMAERKSQVAIGEYNVLDTGGTGTNTRGDYAFIIGNGTSSSARSNALTVDWEGNVNIPSGASYKVNGVAIGGSQVQIIRWDAS